MISELVTTRHLSRKAVVYIHQSHPHQVLSNQESLRLQYALRQRARDLGWREADVEVVDADLAPAEVYATLLDEGVYHCSIRTLYRILDEHAEVRERRDQLRHPVYAKPELLAEAPNQVWSWDITKLMGPAKWTYDPTS